MVLNPFFKSFSVTRTSLCLTTLLVLSACTSTDQSKTANELTPPAVMAPLTATSDYYLEQATKTAGANSVNWQLLAARSFLAGGHTQQALAVLQQLEKLPLSPKQLAEKNLIQAQSFAGEGNLERALTQLKQVDTQYLDQSAWPSYLTLKGRAEQEQGQITAAMFSQMQLAEYLTDAEQIQANNDTIWQLMALHNQAQLRELSQQTVDSNILAWLELGLISKQYSIQPEVLKQQVAFWQSQFVAHPASLYLPTALLQDFNSPPLTTDNVAVFLPLTGKYEVQGQAIRDGMLKAYTDSNSISVVNFYDTNANDMTSLYQTALNQGSNFIVGPLLKSNVESLVKLNTELPMLALNRVEGIRQNNQQFFFSLSPEGEAEQTAQKMFDDGRTYPVVVASKGSFGSRMATAFSDKWQQLTGNTPEIHYFLNRNQLQKFVPSLMHGELSKGRSNRVKQQVSFNVKSNTRHRQDIDGFYVVAQPIELRMFKPFLDVTVDPRLPPIQIYSGARSHPENMNHSEKQDLTGVLYSDLPVILEPDNPVLTEAKMLWPNRGLDDLRFYAMGIDAWHLIPELAALRADPNYQVQGLSGALRLDGDAFIDNYLAWASYENGERILVSPVTITQDGNHYGTAKSVTEDSSANPLLDDESRISFDEEVLIEAPNTIDESVSADESNY
ncbi:penicillin-binding protein activator [Motilimonas cestriensis]|uniref:penicillin-binding protein activator n=1 Tax=Motilimonas cestriensis TaxID=2742685 RepID=UPI003DA4C0DC